jgi:phosphoglycolate phosphatase
VPEKKPSPVPVREMLKKISCRSDEAVIVGDSNYDIEAGRAAGVKTVAVSYGYRHISLLKDADFIIDNMKELIFKLDLLNAT